MSKFNFKTMEYEENRGRPKKRGPKKTGQVTERSKHVAGRGRGAEKKAALAGMKKRSGLLYGRI